MTVTQRDIPDELLHELHTASQRAERRQREHERLADPAWSPAIDGGMESPLAATAGNGARAYSGDYWGACSLETFADASSLSQTHEDAAGFIAYVRRWYPENFWFGDANVKVWAYQEEYDNWQDTYGIDAVLAFYHSGHGTMLGDGRFGAPLGAEWGGQGTWAWSDRMRMGNEQARYLFWSTCFSLRVLDGHNPIRTWDPANLGFRMLFGYETVSYDKPNYGSAFWKHWQTGKSFSKAFLDASWYDVSTRQAPSVVACGATADEALARLDSERAFSWDAVSKNWWQWRWYTAAGAPSATRTPRFELPGELLTGRLGRRQVDERYAAALRSRFELDVPASMRVVRQPEGAGLVSSQGEARLAVDADGSYDVTFRAPNRESTSPIALRAAIAAASDFAAHQGLGETEVVLDRVLCKWDGGGTSEGDGELTEPRIIETVVQFTQKLNGVPVLSPGRGQLSVGVDNDGAITGVRDTTQPVMELGTRPRRVAAGPGEQMAELSLSDVHRALDAAWSARCERRCCAAACRSDSRRFRARRRSATSCVRRGDARRTPRHRGGLRLRPGEAVLNRGADRRLSPVAADEEMRVKVGETFTLRLPAHATSGYAWEASHDPHALDVVHGGEHASARGGAPGAAGEDVFAFRALTPGETVLELRYARAWEREPRDVRRVHVLVEG
jgi:predicted secreted protein